MAGIHNLIIGKKYNLGGEGKFAYIGKDDNGHNFACFIDDKPYNDIWVFPLEEKLLIVEDENILSKENRFPQYRLEKPLPLCSPSEEYERISNIIEEEVQWQTNK